MTDETMNMEVELDNGAAAEMVDHPAHYNEHPSGIECIDVIEYFSFNLGSALKYLWRAGLKPGNDTDVDLQKAIWYIQRERARLQLDEDEDNGRYYKVLCG